MTSSSSSDARSRRRDRAGRCCTAARAPARRGESSPARKEGDPPFSFDPAFQDSRTLHHDDGGYLLERITSLGTHTASHICAPVHFIIGGKRLDQLDEPRGCVLLLNGYAELFYLGRGESSPYVTTPAPGFAGDAVDWLFDARHILATGSDTIGPDRFGC